jgi:transposase
MSWSTVRRAEVAAIARWEAQRPEVRLQMVGIDEKYLGRRHKRQEKYVTIVSNLETGEPIWIGYGRSEATVKQWLDTLTARMKKRIKLVAMDMHEAFKNAIRNDLELSHVDVVHDPFHVMKRANQAVDDLRRAVFFRAGEEMRALGRGQRWLFLRAWERNKEEHQVLLRTLLGFNRQLATAYQVKEELRDVLRAPDEESMREGLRHVLRRSQRRANVPLRKLHESLLDHMPEILALGKHRPPVGRIEALNNNWETLVRMARGYRDHQYLMRKLRFLTVNPLQTEKGVRDFLALSRLAPAILRQAA